MDALHITVEVETASLEPTPDLRTHYRGIEAVTGWGVFELDGDDVDKWPLADAEINIHGFFDSEALGVNPCLRIELVRFGLDEIYALAAIEGYSDNNFGSYSNHARIDKDIEADMRSARDWLDRYKAGEVRTE